MSPDILFSLAGTLALVGWAALLASPVLPKFADAVAGLLVPLLLSAAYAGLIVAYWGSGQGGFGSLDEVAQLFQTRELLLAGWIHYLAFDLFIGAWITREGRRTGMPFWLVLPCLPLTFLFGPAGLLLFFVLRLARSRSMALAA
ncbi:MAG TPA: ABA4-like family protein [Mesorhizobium sp.]|nr:ABA4-like family protein [Mesorhizobium sp.]